MSGSQAPNTESGIAGAAPGRNGATGRGSTARRRAAGVVGRFAAPAGASPAEMGWLGAIVLLAAVLRFIDLPARGGWDSDQATSMFDLERALASGRLPTFGPLSSLMTFHHGALYYDLLLPSAWLGGGDPTWVVGEIALLSLIVIPAVWWMARSIAGPAAGLTAAFLAAISASMIGYATFIWNPTMIEPGAAIAYAGAWQALRTRKPAWWLFTAVGAAVTAQAHVAAGVIVVPLAAAFVVDLWRGPAKRRRRIALWGLAGLGLVAATYLPLIAYEAGHNFPETRGIMAYFVGGGGSTSANGPLVRLIFAAIRILAWPLTRWPMIDLTPAFMPALIAASATIALMIWLVGGTAGPGRRATHLEGGSTEASLARQPAFEPAPDPDPDPTAPPAQDPTPAGRPIDRLGVRLVGSWLLLIVLVLGFGLHSVSEVQQLPTEQYHAMADPLVFVAVGLIVGGLWQKLPRPRANVVRRGFVIGALGLLVAWNVGHWPPLTAPDGGWPAAQAAAARLEQDAGGSSMALVPLFEPKGADAYAYPLSRDGRFLVSPGTATTVVLLCDTFWLDGQCAGSAEADWLNSNPSSGGWIQVDRFQAAPDRLLSVYRRGP